MKRITSFLLPFVAGAALAAPACAQSWEAAPQPPAGASPNQLVPARDAAGNYLTPNRSLSADETSWHVRAALNVAALGCRDTAEAETIAAYNGMIGRHRTPLAAADTGVKAQYRARFGGDWEAAHDKDMTRLYNFFAQPPAQAGFCAAAREVLSEVGAVDPEHFGDYAAYALPRLEASFIDFYREYDAYRVAQFAWQNRAQVPTATLASVPAIPAPGATFP